MWNWEQPDWPEFSWNPARLARAEEQFLLERGVLVGTAKHLDGGDRDRLIVEAMSGEALSTSAIEGEFLNRASVQSSVQRQLGLATDKRRVAPAEQGVSEMMVDLYRKAAEPLSRSLLCGWQRMLMAGRRDLGEIGTYRTGSEPMQVVSGASYKRKVHFEAPPSSRVPAETDRFIAWFNRTAPNGKHPLPALTRAGIAHLYFESIHPFEDGNGRVGRAIAEKALTEGFGQTAIIALGRSILAHQSDYYKLLEASNKQNEITEWLAWFGGIAIEAQRRSVAQVEFLIDKTKLLDRLRGQLNDRQKKVILRMMKEGAEGFKGGLSAGNYATIAKSATATTTRDLADLVDKGALIRTGERKYARYGLNLPLRNVQPVQIGKNGQVRDGSSIRNISRARVKRTLAS